MGSKSTRISIYLSMGEEVIPKNKGKKNKIPYIKMEPHKQKNTQWWVFLAILYPEYRQNYGCKRNCHLLGWCSMSCSNCKETYLMNPPPPKPQTHDPGRRAHVGTYIFGTMYIRAHNASSDREVKVGLMKWKSSSGWWLMDGCPQ